MADGRRDHHHDEDPHHEHNHDEHNHSHHHDSHNHHSDHTSCNHELPREKFTLRGAFNHVAQYVRKKKVESGVLLTSLLLGTTSLATPMMSTAVGAAAVMAGSIYLLTKTTDITLDNLLGFGSKMGMSALTLGLLIGGLNTIPEVMVSLGAVAKGAIDIGVGNVVGSNIAHVLLILGATAAVAGIGKSQNGLSWKFNTAVMAGATALFGVQLAMGTMSPLLGAGMLGLGAYYLKKRLFTGKDGKEKTSLEDDCATEKCLFHDHGHDHDHDEDVHTRPAWFSAVLGGAGLVGLMGAAGMLVESGSAFAAQGLGISEALVGTMAVAIGTSLPELMISVKSALKNHADLAVGNVVGCSIFNTLVAGGVMSAYMGVTGMAVPDAFNPTTAFGAMNLAAFLGTSGLLAGVLLSNKGAVKRWQGMAMLGLYAAYVAGSLALNGGNLDHFHKHDVEAPAPVIEQVQDVDVAINHLPNNIVLQDDSYIQAAFHEAVNHDQMNATFEASPEKPSVSNGLRANRLFSLEA